MGNFKLGFASLVKGLCCVGAVREQMCLKAAVPSGLNFRLFLTWKNTVFLSLERQDILPWPCRSLELRKSVPRAVPTLPGFQLNLIKTSIELLSLDKSLIPTRKLFSSDFILATSDTSRL